MLCSLQDIGSQARITQGPAVATSPNPGTTTGFPQWHVSLPRSQSVCAFTVILWILSVPEQVKVYREGTS